MRNLYKFIGRPGKIYVFNIEPDVIKLNYKCKRGTVDSSNACGLEKPTSTASDNDNIKLINILKNGKQQYAYNGLRYDLGKKTNTLYKKMLRPGNELQLQNLSDDNVKTLTPMLSSLAKESDRLGIPRIRGVCSTKATTGRLACMSDGILELSSNVFDTNPDLCVKKETTLCKERIKETKRIIDNEAKTVEIYHMTPERAADYHEVVEKYKKELIYNENKLKDIQKNGVDAIISKWKPGDLESSRPTISTGYFNIKDKPDILLTHEFGHHIHEQFGLTKENYKQFDGQTETPGQPLYTPMEQEFRKIREDTMKDGTIINPTKYSEAAADEWFAESYTLYKHGREDLVTPKLLDYFKEKKL